MTYSHGYYLLCLDWVTLERDIREGRIERAEGRAGLADLGRAMTREYSAARARMRNDELREIRQTRDRRTAIPQPQGRFP